MNNILENNIFVQKNEYNSNNNTKKINKIQKYIFDNEQLKTAIKDSFTIQYNKYNSLLYYIMPSHSSYINTASIVFDEKKLPYRFVNDTILKTKLITWDMPIFFFIIFNYLPININKKDNVLLMSRNYGIVEMMKFYKYINVDHIKYSRKNDVFADTINTIIEKVKSIYKFNDIDFNTKINNKYKFMIFDIIALRITSKYVDKINYNKIKEIEDASLYLLEAVYNYLDNLEKHSDIIILLSSCMIEETIIILENIFNCFNKIEVYEIKPRPGFFPYIYCSNFKGKNKKEDKISEKMYNFIQSTYLNTINNVNNLINKTNYINDLLLNRPYSDELKQMEIKNLYISNEVARFIGLETYLFKDNLNVELSKNAMNLYAIDVPIIIYIHRRDQLSFKIKKNNNIEQIQELDMLYELHTKTIEGIDFRPIHIYNSVKKQIRFYESSLNIEILKLGIKMDNNKPVSRAWIKMYEMLSNINFASLYRNNKTINTFHLCEAPGGFIHSLLYYMKKHMPDTKLEWHATTLQKTDNSNIGFGDDYGMMRSNPTRWSFGCDKTGDITKVENIKYYKKICMDVDFIISDCGLPWTNDPIPMVKLYYAQILFILHNLKKGGNCLFKFLIPIKHKILIDAIYLLYITFDKLTIFKSIQNKFSGEFYMICYNYNNSIITDFNDLFEILKSNNIDKMSIIVTDYNADFKYQFIKGIEMITNSFIETVNMQLFYTDFWNNLDNNIKNNIKNMINIKNKDFINRYFIK